MKSMTQSDVVNALSDRGLNITLRTYQNWEGGATQPKYTQLLALRDVLGIRLNGKGGKGDSDKECAPHLGG